MEDTIYDHYIAIDWSIKNMAIARMTKKSNKITAIDVPSDIEDLHAYLRSLKRTKILTIEETTTSQWLYAELKEYVDRILICERNLRGKMVKDTHTMTKGNLIELKRPETFLNDPKTDVLRNGSRKFLAEALETEFELFLPKYADLKDEFGRKRTAQDGYLPECEIQNDIVPFSVKVPRARDRQGVMGSRHNSGLRIFQGYIFQPLIN